jgi:membrane-associated phospholipid phosphatase
VGPPIYSGVVDSLIVFVAKYFVFVSIAVVGLFWLTVTRRDKVSLGLRLIIGGVVALALAKVGAHFYYDTRPFVRDHIKPLIAHANDNGFPSDHTLLASFLGFTVLAYSRSMGLLLLAMAALIGGARVASHIHSPIDIVGSFVIAGIAAVLTHQGFKYFGSDHAQRTWRQRKL